MHVSDIGVGGDAEWVNLPSIEGIGNVGFVSSTRLVAPAPDGRLILWDLGTGVAVRPVGRAPDQQDFDVSPDGRSIAIASSGSRNGVRIVTLAPGVPRLVVPNPTDVDIVDWSPDGSQLVMAAFGAGARIVDRSGRLVRTLSEADPRPTRPGTVRTGGP